MKLIELFNILDKNEIDIILYDIDEYLIADNENGYEDLNKYLDEEIESVSCSHDGYLLIYLKMKKVIPRHKAIAQEIAKNRKAGDEKRKLQASFNWATGNNLQVTMSIKDWVELYMRANPDKFPIIDEKGEVEL